MVPACCYLVTPCPRVSLPRHRMQHACSMESASLTRVPFFFSATRLHITHNSCSCPPPSLDDSPVHALPQVLRGQTARYRARGPTGGSPPSGSRCIWRPGVHAFSFLQSDFPVLMPFPSCHRRRPHPVGLLLIGLYQVGCQNLRSNFLRSTRIKKKSFPPIIKPTP